MKGQIEMMGLVIIVILIVISGLLFVRFGLQTEEPKQEATIQTAQTYHLLNAMIKTTMCEETTVKQAIDACNKEQNSCNQDACVLVKTEIEKMLQQATSKKTRITIYNNDKEVVNSGECTYGTAAPPYFFKEAGREYEISLKQCE